MSAVIENTTEILKSKCKRPDRNSVGLNLATNLYVSNFTRKDEEEEPYVFFPVKRAIHPKVLYN